jgi:hypothetical protein
MLVKGMALGAPPALSSVAELGKAAKTKDALSKTSHLVKSLGIASGRIPTQLVDSTEGLIELMTGETNNWMRLFFSEYALGKDKKKERA